MTLGRGVARFNRLVTNRLTAPFAGRLPGFGIVVHVGRRSGREHRTPVNVFRRGDAFTIALTYGSEAQWVRNVLAAGGCRLIVRGREHRVVEPHVVRDQPVPAPVRAMLRLMRVDEFLRLTAAPPPSPPAGPRPA